MLLYRETQRERGRKRAGRERKISAENELQISFWSFVWSITFFTPLTLLNTAKAPSLPLYCCCCSFSHNVLRSTNYSQQQQKGVEIWAPDTPLPPLGRCQGVCAPLVGLFYLSCRCCLLNNLSPRSSTLPPSPPRSRHAS